MASDIETDRALAAITATVNDQGMDEFDRDRVQAVVDSSLDGESRFRVDDGGGIHDETGARIGTLRRTSGGGWIAERQNPEAEGSGADVPTAPSS